jgi:exosortase B
MNDSSTTMSASTSPPPSWSGHRWGPWLVVLAGLAMLCVPTVMELSQTLWRQEEHAHGPIVLAVAVWLLWTRARELSQQSTPSSSSGAGWPVLLLSLVVYIVGRAFSIMFLEISGVILAIAAAVLLMEGRATLKVVWFPLFFMAFAVPLPGPIVDTLTTPMKHAVSAVTESILFALGYPIARSGVVLKVGQYQLLVADACAGLQTLLTLEAMGLLYLNLVRHASLFRNVALALLIIPISFFANVTRVVTLTLITFHFGDEAGQGFLHGFAGMVLFLAGLVLVVFADSALRVIARRWSRLGAAK